MAAEIQASMHACHSSYCAASLCRCTVATEMQSEMHPGAHGEGASSASSSPQV